MPDLTVSPDDLCGEWSLRRRVVDRMAAASGRATGTLTVSTASDGVRWEERGTLAIGDYSGSFTRELRARLIDGQWWMTFTDGRPFHPWAPGRMVEHPCRADVYRGLVTGDRTRLRILWDVTGPRKQQRLLTRLDRT